MLLNNTRLEKWCLLRFSTGTKCFFCLRIKYWILFICLAYHRIVPICNYNYQKNTLISSSCLIKQKLFLQLCESEIQFSFLLTGFLANFVINTSNDWHLLMQSTGYVEISFQANNIRVIVWTANFYQIILYTLYMIDKFHQCLNKFKMKWTFNSQLYDYIHNIYKQK